MSRRKLILTISQYDLNGKLLKTYPNAKVAAETVGSSQRYISYAAQGKKALTACGYLWRRGAEPQLDMDGLLSRRWYQQSPLATKQHTVGQYDLYGKLVATYTNTKEAGRAVGFHYQGIRKVMRGEALTYGGFIWSKQIKKKIDVNPRIIPDTTVSQYDLDGKWLRSFPNAYVASKETGVQCACIHHVLNGTLLTAGRFLWRRSRQLRINVNELRQHPHFSRSAVERHLKKKRAKRLVD